MSALSLSSIASQPALTSPDIQPTKVVSPKVRQYELAAFVPFVLMHLLPLLAFFSGVTWQALTTCAVLYFVRMFGVTGGYHRYFSHRTFKTGRITQFFLAFLAQTSMQRGVLWWAAHHRHHHKYSDDARDVHSPVQDGFWYSHLGWIYNYNSETAFDRVRDLAKYPELRFLNQYYYLPPAILAAVTFAAFGWSGLLIGFCLSTVLLWHGTFFINSLAHVWGSRRYQTEDDSRNNFWLALITLGEGWHNNHHHYMHCARQGFFWWEIDVTYYIIKAMSAVGLVWEIRELPAKIKA